MKKTSTLIEGYGTLPLEIQIARFVERTGGRLMKVERFEPFCIGTRSFKKAIVTVIV